VALTSRPVRTSLLDRDRVYGLRLGIARCSTSWHRLRSAHRYVCAGQRTLVLASRPVVGYGVPLRGLADLPWVRAAHLLLTLRLPAAAPNAFERQRSALAYTFTAVQAAP